MRFDPKRYASADEVQSGRVRRIFDYWCGKASGGRIPLRASIDPTELVDLLPCLMIVEVIEGRFRYRLVGTEVAANAGGDFTGCFLDAQNFANRDFYLACYREVLKGAAPVFGLDHWAYSDGRSGVAEFAMLPLSVDGTAVAQILTMEDTKEVASPGRNAVR
ncbi:PAS domain-containing protein [Dongia sedimenti]|uniref:PAS domain-containing protein n=1 Tax=Dongia sedimenti TaxID=3064282 RepID=A0ABU0YJ88_9PROT|nr:PAS domain-containing protein [Rhodospirillaceae bacterium R-7]